MLFKKNNCVHKNPLFGVHYKLEKSSARTFLRAKMTTLLLSMVYVIRKCWIIFFLQWNQRLKLGDMWFQQDGVICHSAFETLTLLQTKFIIGHVISKKDAIDWPPRCYDLTPLGLVFVGLFWSKEEHQTWIYCEDLWKTSLKINSKVQIGLLNSGKIRR